MKLVCLIMASLAIAATATLKDDEAECSQHLADLAACIPYVSGTAKKPTPQCCQDATKLKAADPKCLCVLIIASTDPNMGLPVNTTLALEMPSACNIDAKVSNCPSLLNISPDSPDAKVFKEAGISDSSSSSTAGSSSTKESPPSSTSSSSDSPSSSSSSSSPASGSGSTDSSSKTDSKASTSSSDGHKAYGGWMLMALAAGILF